MNLKTEIVALAVRVLAEKTDLVRKPDAFEEFLGTMFTGESYDKRAAADVIGKTDEVVRIVKSVTSRLKANKQIQNG